MLRVVIIFFEEFDWLIFFLGIIFRISYFWIIKLGKIINYYLQIVDFKSQENQKIWGNERINRNYFLCGELYFFEIQEYWDVNIKFRNENRRNNDFDDD